MKGIYDYNFPNKQNVCAELSILNVIAPNQLIDYIFSLYDFYNKEEVHIYSKYLRTAWGRNYNKILKVLVDNQIIVKTKNHLAEVESATYRLLKTPEAIAQTRQVLIEKFKPKTKKYNLYIDRLFNPLKFGLRQAYADENINKVRKSNIEQYKAWVKQTKVNISDTQYNALNKTQQRYVDAINAGRFTYSTDKYNARIYSNINQLEKELRKNITLDGKTTCEVDMKTSYCQTILHNPAIFGADKNFVQHVQKGDVYYYIAWHLKCTRKQAKDAFNATLNASATSYQSKAIKHLFPMLFKKVDKLKSERGNKIISKILMRLEARKINQIAKELCEKGIIHHNIHDGFLVQKCQAQTVIAIFLKNNIKASTK